MLEIRIELYSNVLGLHLVKEIILLPPKIIKMGINILNFTIPFLVNMCIVMGSLVEKTKELLEHEPKLSWTLSRKKTAELTSTETKPPPKKSRKPKYHKR
jgi:hypothetical protein